MTKITVKTRETVAWGQIPPAPTPPAFCPVCHALLPNPLPNDAVTAAPIDSAGNRLALPAAVLGADDTEKATEDNEKE